MGFSAPGGGIQQGDAPITSGVAGSVAGVLQALSDGADPGLVQLDDANEILYYLNVGSLGIARLGIIDPVAVGDPDVNEPLVESGGGLLVDGANWMTGRLMSADPSGARLSSRAGLLTAIDDDFESGTINATLWTSASITEAGGVISFSGSADELGANYLLDGDFDIRIAVQGSTGFQASTGLMFRVAFGTTAENRTITSLDDANSIITRLRVNSSAADPIVGWSIDNVAAQSLVPVHTDGQFWFGLRITRVGNTFSIYYLRSSATQPDITADDGWILVDSGAMAPSAGDQGRVQFGIRTTAISNLADFHAPVASPVPPAPTGPVWRVGSLSTFGASERLIEFFAGPETDSTLRYAFFELDSDGDATIQAGDGTYRGILFAGSVAADSDPGLLGLMDVAGPLAHLAWWESGDFRGGGVAKPTTPATDGFVIGPSRYGMIYVDTGVTNQVLNATPSTYDIVTAFNTARGFDGPAQLLVTPAKASNKITLGLPGVYHVSYVVSFERVGGSAFDAGFALFLDAGIQSGTIAQRTSSSGGAVGSVSGIALITVPSNALDLDLRVTSFTTGGETILISHCQLCAIRIG